MSFYLLALGWVSVSLVVYWLINRHIREKHYAAERKRLGCQEPPALKTSLPFGIDEVQRSIKADREKRFAEYLWQRSSQFGGRTNAFRVLGARNYYTHDPQIIKAILATRFKDFGLGEKRRGNFFPLLGNGIFTTDGQMWEHSRGMMRPQFAREQVSNLQLEEDHVQNLFRVLPVNSQQWTAQTDLQKLFFRLTLDSACEFLMGESANSQLLLDDHVSDAEKQRFSKGAPDPAEFAIAFDRGQAWLASRGKLGHLYYMVNGLDFQNCIKVCHQFVDYFVDLALKRTDPNILKQGISDEEAGKYIFAHALAEQIRDPVELRSQILNILLAGRDTTASLLGWTFYELARKPHLYTKLREDVLSEFGTGTDKISFSSLKSCTPLQHVLNETLRLNPVVPVNIREALNDTTIPCGGGPDGKSPIFVPKGTDIFYSVYSMHRDTGLWGADSLEYRPDRWIGRRPGWEFLPFNGGPRICIGQQFALTEASYVMVRMLQRFDGIQNCDSDPIKHHLTLTDCPGGAGVLVRLHAAS